MLPLPVPMLQEINQRHQGKFELSPIHHAGLELPIKISDLDQDTTDCPSGRGSRPENEFSRSIPLHFSPLAKVNLRTFRLGPEGDDESLKGKPDILVHPGRALRDHKAVLINDEGPCGITHRHGYFPTGKNVDGVYVPSPIF